MHKIKHYASTKEQGRQLRSVKQYAGEHAAGKERVQAVWRILRKKALIYLTSMQSYSRNAGTDASASAAMFQGWNPTGRNSVP